MNLTVHAELAQASGFAAAAKNALEILDRKNRLARAFEHYRYVTEGQITAFDHALRKRTERAEGEYPALWVSFDFLKLTPIGEYQGKDAEGNPSMPPTDIMNTVKEAKDAKIFDTMEVASVESIREYRDPIVFGRVTGCPHYFYIGQWDDDVTIDQLLGTNED